MQSDQQGARPGSDGYGIARTGRWQSIRALGFGCILLGVVLLSGCATRPTGYGSIEEHITARGGVGENGVFHDVLYNPQSLSLNFPGYIIGLDKGRRASVAPDEDFSPAHSDAQWGIYQFRERLRQDPKVHYISHVIRNTGKPYGDGNCVLYSIYDKWGGGYGQHAADNVDRDVELGCDGRRPVFGNFSEAFRESDTALATLDRELATHAKNYSHVIVVVMGWNTPQLEAVQNWNAIGTHLRNAARGSDFRPLVIGISWASEWSSSWFEPAVRLVSFTAKAGDADEVGLSWLALTLNTIQKNFPNTPKLAIGHSFGARALVSALCTGSQLPGRREMKPPPWDMFFGWQPAFPISRFTPGGAVDGFAYVQGCANVRTLVMTASENDLAVRSGLAFDMVGSAAVRESTCNKLANFTRRVHCTTASNASSLQSFGVAWQSGDINYVDASEIVWFSHPNTGGGAHSDIYRAVHGRLVWSAVVNATSTASASD